MRAGFTLLELLIVIAIVSIISTLAWPNLRQLQQNGNLKDATQEFVGTLRLEQAQAIAGQGNASHTIHYLSSSSYQTLTGSTVTKTVSFPGTVRFASSFSDIIFTRLTGAVSTAATITITGGDSKKVSVSTSGVITTP